MTGRTLSRAAAGLALVLIMALILLSSAPRAVRAQEEPPPGGELEKTTGNVYFYLDGELSPVPRDIAMGGQTIEFAVLEVLKGPSEEEKAVGYVTYIPEGVKMLYSSIKQDRTEYSVNLSREFLELAGDREAAVKALAQLVKTVREVSQIENVKATIAAEESGAPPLDAFQALGITPEEVDAEISGAPPEERGGGFPLLAAVGIPVLCLLAAAVAVLLWRRRAVKEEKGEVRRLFPGRRRKAAGIRAAGFVKRPGSMKVGGKPESKDPRKNKGKRSRKGRRKEGKKEGHKEK